MKTGYKRLFLFVVTLLTTLCADAQHKGYEVGYDRAHYFYQMGDELSIIDMDMEWPRRLDGAQVEPLCRYMTKELFGEEDVSLKAATDKYLKRFGQPVNQAFGTMPDDSKYCHVAIGSKLIGYESGRYVSFQLTLMQQPESASSQLPRQVSKLLTYNLASGRVMATEEMLRLRRINDVFYRDHFVSCIASGALIKEEPDSVDVSNWPLDVCYADGYMVFDLGFKETNQLHNSIAMVSCEKMDFYLDTKFKKWLKTASAPKAEEEGSLGFSESISGQENGLSDEACVIFTDTMPQFDGGLEALVRQISTSLRYPEMDFYLEREGKVVLAYVVEKNGMVGDVAVIKGVTPTIDREAVRVLRSVCCWKPGMKDGKPVAVKQVIPIIFKLSEIQFESK